MLPWNETTEDNLDLEHARQILDEDHYDLEKVKERIIEYLAVSKLKDDVSGPILCFVGPPGVGKTSLGQSIARTLGRKFMRISVGGVRDEAEIRGHRRTYIGAMPGTIIRALRDAESKNPVFLIDEIDKMGADFRGDPASAMLEVLDPAQHRQVPRPLPRPAVRPLEGALHLHREPARDDPAAPARPHGGDPASPATRRTRSSRSRASTSFRSQLEEHGLDAERVEIDDDALALVIREYTREAGVRNLERQIAALCRKAARADRRGRSARRCRVDEERVREWLGPRRFSGEVRKRTADPGVATGLAVTAVGGDVLFIEATAYPGNGHAHDHRTARRGHAGVGPGGVLVGSLPRDELGVDPEWFEKHDIHIHVPAGAVPKDGPSAGITMATAIVSLVTGRPVSDDVAMTGEITLTGQVLPIGGVREKVLAAQRAGLKNVILPRENEADLADLPGETRGQMEFVLADTIDDVLAEAFDSTGAVGRPAAPASDRRRQRLRRSPAGTRIRRNRPKGRACVQRRRRTRTRGLMSSARSPTTECATTSRTRSTRPGTSTTSSSAGAAVSPSHSVSRPTATSTGT